MNNSGFGKTMKNMRKQEDIKLVTTKARSSYLLSEPIYHAKKFLSKDLLATHIVINKPTYIGLSTLEISQLVMYKFWYDNVKPKYWEKTKMRYMDTESYIVDVKA